MLSARPHSESARNELLQLFVISPDQKPHTPTNAGPRMPPRQSAFATRSKVAGNDDKHLRQVESRRTQMLRVYRLGVDAGWREASLVARQTLTRQVLRSEWRYGVLCGLVPGGMITVAALLLGRWAGY